MEKQNRYFLVWKLNTEEAERPLIRIHRMADEVYVYRGKGIWEANKEYGGIFWGDIEADEITEDKAKSIASLKDK